MHSYQLIIKYELIYNYTLRITFENTKFINPIKDCLNIFPFFLSCCYILRTKNYIFFHKFIKFICLHFLPSVKRIKIYKIDFGAHVRIMYINGNFRSKKRSAVNTLRMISRWSFNVYRRAIFLNLFILSQLLLVFLLFHINQLHFIEFYILF